MKAGLCKTLEEERIAERERDSAHGGIAILKITCIERPVCKRRRKRIKPRLHLLSFKKKTKTKNPAPVIIQNELNICNVFSYNFIFKT